MHDMYIVISIISELFQLTYFDQVLLRLLDMAMVVSSYNLPPFPDDKSVSRESPVVKARVYCILRSLSIF